MFDVYSPSLTHLGEAEMVSSANWSLLWTEIGGVNLVAALTDENIRLLEPDNYLVLQNARPEANPSGQPIYLIVDVSRDRENSTITVRGKSADYLLHRRGCTDLLIRNGTAEASAKNLINQNLRGLPFSAIRHGGQSDQFNIPVLSLSSGSLDEMALEILASANYGRQIYFDPSGAARLIYAIDSGTNKRGSPNVPILGTESGSGRNVALEDDRSIESNVGIAAMHYADETVRPLEVGSTAATGADRREIHCGDYFIEDGETEAQFVARASADMLVKMADAARRISYSATIEPADYGTVFRVGDMIQARDGETIIDRRITGAVFTMEDNGLRVSLRLGEPILTVFKEIKDKAVTHPSIRSGGGGVGGVIGSTKKKVYDLHEKQMNMNITLGDVDAGLKAQIKNYDDFKEAATQVYAKVDKTAAGLDLVASEDVRNGLKAANTSLYAKITNADGTGFSAAMLNLSAVSADGKTRTLAQLLADVITLQGNVEILGNLSIKNGMLWVDKGIVSELAITGNNIFANGTGINGIVSGRRVSCTEFAINGNEYTPQSITSTSGDGFTVLAQK